MKCPSCHSSEDKVIESRSSHGNEIIRRRRECLECQYRFTTYERIEAQPVMVVKRNGTKELFNHQKLLKGLLRAFEKRPVGQIEVEKITHAIEDKLLNSSIFDISSDDIGRLTLEYIKDLDQVAYIRFASVYRKFNDIEEFASIVHEMTTANAISLASQRQDQSEKTMNLNANEGVQNN